MDIENLIINIKTKLLKNSSYSKNIKIEDKTYLHLKHLTRQKSISY